MASGSQGLPQRYGRLPHFCQRTDAIYAERLDKLKRMLSVEPRDTAAELYWGIMDVIDDWEWEDANVELLGDAKKRRIGEAATVSLPPQTSIGGSTATGAGGSQPDAVMPEPTAGSTHVRDKGASGSGTSAVAEGTVLSAERAAIIAKNREAALERLRQKKASADAAKQHEIFEAMQWL